MAIVHRLLALLALGLSACVGHPDFRVATPENIQAGTATNRAQQQVTADIVCPPGTRRREFLEAETRVQSGRGGAPSTVVRVQCIPNDARPGEIPPLARPAEPLPPAARPLGYGEFRRPYVSEYERVTGVGNTLPRGYWEGGAQGGYYHQGRRMCYNPWSGYGWYECMGINRQ